MVRANTREKIVTAADLLFYEKGFENTSFAVVAKEVGISRGNFYHHFKTKDQILEAVIERRLQDRKIMLDRWEIEGETPKQRVASFIRILLVNATKIRAFGCPVGSLFHELSKIDHESETDAVRLFDLFRHWLCQQFTKMGHTHDADYFAMTLLARSQGVAMVANAYPKEDFLEREVAQMLVWLDAVSSASLTHKN